MSIFVSKFKELWQVMSPGTTWTSKSKNMKAAHVNSEPSTNTEDSGDDGVSMYDKKSIYLWCNVIIFSHFMILI
jgi:hypothetical protein